MLPLQGLCLYYSYQSLKRCFLLGHESSGKSSNPATTLLQVWVCKDNVSCAKSAKRYVLKIGLNHSTCSPCLGEPKCDQFHFTRLTSDPASSLPWKCTWYPAAAARPTQNMCCPLSLLRADCWLTRLDLNTEPILLLPSPKLSENAAGCQHTGQGSAIHFPLCISYPTVEKFSKNSLHVFFHPWTASLFTLPTAEKEGSQLKRGISVQ